MQEVYKAWGDTPEEAVRVLNAAKKRLENERRRNRNKTAAAAAAAASTKRMRSDAPHTPMKKRASSMQGKIVSARVAWDAWEKHGKGMGRHGKAGGPPWKELS